MLFQNFLFLVFTLHLYFCKKRRKCSTHGKFVLYKGVGIKKIVQSLKMEIYRAGFAESD